MQDPTIYEAVKRLNLGELREAMTSSVEAAGDHWRPGTKYKPLNKEELSDLDDIFEGFAAVMEMTYMIAPEQLIEALDHAKQEAKYWAEKERLGE